MLGTPLFQSLHPMVFRGVRKAYRAVPLTTLFLVSEGVLLTAPLVLDSGPWDVLWRVLLIPAYIAITGVSWITPWTAHAPVVATILMLTTVLDAFLWRSESFAAGDRASA